MSHHESTSRQPLFRKTTKKKVLGVLLGLAYLAGCLFALFDIEAQMPADVAQEWLENYMFTFVLDLLIYRGAKCLFNIPAILLVVKLQSSWFLKILTLLLHDNVVALFKT